MSGISVVTVNFNQPEVTEQLIASIERCCPVLPEIIVIDNGSTKNRVPAWQLAHPHVKFIRSDVNLGFAGGNNLGIREATGDYLFLVNNDTEFTEGLTQTLLETLKKHDRAGVVCPKIRFYSHPDTLQYAGYTDMNYYTVQNATIGLQEKDKGQYDGIEAPTAYAHGAAMLMKKEVIAKAGEMPENFFLYYEEMDWCERIREAGFEIWVNTDALIYHKESISVGQQSALKEFFMNRNRILFARRNSHGLKKYFFYLYFALLVAPRNIVRYLFKKQYAFPWILVRAVWWNLTHKTDSRDLGYSFNKIR